MNYQRIIKWLKNEKCSYFFIYGAVALLVMLPLLLPGFILTLDMVFVPHMPLPDSLTNTWLLEFVLWLVNFVLPADVIQKIILLTILILSGAGLHRLVLSTATGDHDYLKWGAYFAGIFYMVNPFTYSRFMAGQWLVLLGYALLPFFVQSLISLVTQPGKKTAVRSALWATAIALVSVHTAGMLAIILLVALGIMAWKYWGSPRFKKLLKWSAISVGLALVINSFWLLPTMFGQTEIAKSVSTFNDTHHEAFATDSSGPFGAVGNVIRLQGFWVEPRGFYILPQDQVPVWGLISIGVWVLTGIGAVAAWRKQRFMALFFGIVGLLAILLAATPITTWLGPIMNGYREPHKFVALLALSYAYFGALGAVGVGQWAAKKWGEMGASIALAVVMIIPFLFTSVMLWGFGGQLKPRHYPNGWNEINQQLEQSETTGRGLFLPWHQYMSFGFTERIIANPAEKFFGPPLVISDNPEFEGIGPAYPDEEKRRIEQALNDPEMLAQTLNELNVQFILLAKESDYQDYDHLNTIPSLKLITETDSLIYYQNEAYQHEND